MESLTSQTVNGNGPLLAETAPLLGSNHTTAARERRDPDVEDGRGEDDATAAVAAENNGSSDDPAKPKVNMTALLPALAIGVFLGSLDQTLTLATYGKIGSELAALSSTSWIATSYFLTLTAFQPLYGKLSDIFGRKACLLFAYAVFGLGCLGCGLARSMLELCIARAVAGIGGGGINAVISILVTDLVSLRERGVWQGYLNIIYAGGVAAGAPIGGLFADNIGWRWAFIGQCPLALLALIAVYFVLHLPQTDLDSRWTAKMLRIDFLGAFTLLAAVFLLLFGLDKGSEKGWDQRITWIPLALAPVLFAIFVLVEAKVAKEPFAPGHVIFHPPLLAAYCANFFGVAAQMGVMFFSALFFQAALAMSATHAGLLFLPSTVFGLTGSLGGGLVMRRTGRYYFLAITGYSLLLLGCVPMVVGAGYMSAPLTVVGLTILMFGTSISLTSTLIAIIANATPGDTAIAIACSYLFRSLGTTLGISISTATLQQMLRVTLADQLGGPDAGEIEKRVRLSLDYIRTLDPAVAAVVRRCYAIATQWAFVPAGVFAALAITSALFIKEKKLDR